MYLQGLLDNGTWVKILDMDPNEKATEKDFKEFFSSIKDIGTLYTHRQWCKPAEFKALRIVHD